MSQVYGVVYKEDKRRRKIKKKIKGEHGEFGCWGEREREKRRKTKTKKGEKKKMHHCRSAGVSISRELLTFSH